MTDIIDITNLPPSLPADTPEWARMLFTEVRAIRATHDVIMKEIDGIVDVAQPLVENLGNHPMLKMFLGA